MEPLYAQLEEDPDDPATLAVLADELQLAGDPRGELISIQLALASAAPDIVRERGLVGREDVVGLSRRRGVLLQQLAPPFEPRHVTWGIGFVRALEQQVNDVAQLRALVDALGHPSMRMLRELKLWIYYRPSSLAELAARIPTVRRLEIASADLRDAELADAIPRLPWLESLHFDSCRHVGPFGHPRLKRLELHSVDRDEAYFGKLVPAELPSLRVIDFCPRVVEGAFDERTRMPTFERVDGERFLRLLGPWLPQLEQLRLAVALGERGFAALVDGLGGRKLQRLELDQAELAPAVRSRVATLCDVLVPPRDQETGIPQWAEHANQPDWGRGRILRRFADKLEIEFPNAGKRVFKASAPFLKLS